MFKNKKGFTIVELVIVIAVIAILAAVLIPTFSSVIKKANDSSALQKARTAFEVVASETADGESAFEENQVYIRIKNDKNEYVDFVYNGSKVEQMKTDFSSTNLIKLTASHLSKEARKDLGWTGTNNTTEGKIEVYVSNTLAYSGGWGTAPANP